MGQKLFILILLLGVCFSANADRNRPLKDFITAPDHVVIATIVKTTLGRTRLRMAFRNKIIFKGELGPPESRGTEDDLAMKAWVASQKFAIGYLSADTPTQGVKVINIVD